MKPAPFNLLISFRVSPIWPPAESVSLLNSKSDLAQLGIAALPTGQWLIRHEQLGTSAIETLLPVIDLHSTGCKAFIAMAGDRSLRVAIGGQMVLHPDVNRNPFERVAIPGPKGAPSLLWHLLVEKDDRQHALLDEPLHKSDAALKRLKLATTYKEAVESWTDFLVSWRRCINRCDAIGKPASGRKWTPSAAIADDQTLTFINEARNAVEHGLLQTVEITPRDCGALEGGVPGTFDQPAALKPVALADRGREIAVPAFGLGIHLDDPTPMQLAEIAQVFAWRVRNAVVDLVGEQHWPSTG